MNSYWLFHVFTIFYQCWANGGLNIGPILVKTCCTILGKYWVQYWPNIGYFTLPQYFTNIVGPTLANNAGQC